eukprot:TRINITY_DN79687_c0_g1_i1.p1 TRINITY_DN79687_c0_g1~~TRINITY_DN79687_c0_g1_i1.p1  ORF type:complete len:336 (-),score=59.81 TRINITY_DN79687_c0_g1_i1:32-1039(-)
MLQAMKVQLLLTLLATGRQVHALRTQHRCAVSTVIHAKNLTEMSSKSKFCRQLVTEERIEALAFAFDANSNTLCAVGHGYETRAEASMDSVRDAMKALGNSCKTPKSFKHVYYSLRDEIPHCGDWTWTTDVPAEASCKTRALPDFSFNRWPEAGLLPNFSFVSQKLHRVSKMPAQEQVCGWAGNLGGNEVRGRFYQKAKNKAYWEVIVPRTQGARLSMEDQVKRWACLVDLPASGYSGRVPLLLHSGRPLLMIARKNGKPHDQTWYSANLTPWVHYIPVKNDLSDLEEKTKFALGMVPGSNASQIAAAALEFAKAHLSYDAAVRRIADEFMALKR